MNIDKFNANFPSWENQHTLIQEQLVKERQESQKTKWNEQYSTLQFADLQAKAPTKFIDDPLAYYKHKITNTIYAYDYRSRTWSEPDEKTCAYLNAKNFFE